MAVTKEEGLVQSLPVKLLVCVGQALFTGLHPCVYVPGQHSISQMAGGNLSKASAVTEGCCV